MRLLQFIYTSTITVNICLLKYSRHPEVKWAQRLDKVFITVQLPDSKDSKVNLEPDGVFTFSGSAGSENHHYELKLELFDKVNVEVCRHYFCHNHIFSI